MPASITITSLHPQIFTDIWDNLGPSIASMIIHGFFSGTHNLDLLKGSPKNKKYSVSRFPKYPQMVDCPLGKF